MRSKTEPRVDYIDATYWAVLDNLLPVDEPDEHEQTLLERVYVVLDREACLVKIGWTRDVTARLRHLSWQRRHPLELLGTFEGGRDLERMFHREYAGYLREGREWFSTEILAYLLPLLTSSAPAQP